MSYEKEFYGMKYPFDKCERPELLKMKRCLDCSVREFCEAPEKLDDKASSVESDIE